MIKMVYDKRRNQFFEEENYYSQSEIEEKNMRAMKARFAEDKRIQEEYARTHRHGTCPHCHLVIPASGICDCGYDARLNTNK